jgi:hypothetical protein
MRVRVGSRRVHERSPRAVWQRGRRQGHTGEDVLARASVARGRRSAVGRLSGSVGASTSEKRYRKLELLVSGQLLVS